MEGNVKTKRNKSKAEIVYICNMLASPDLHFCLFWLYINLDTVVLSFQRFNMNEGVWEFAGWENYRELWREFTKEGSVLPRAVLNSFSVFLWND